jgi:hypothetical protein
MRDDGFPPNYERKIIMMNEIITTATATTTTSTNTESIDALRIMLDAFVEQVESSAVLMVTLQSPKELHAGGVSMLQSMRATSGMDDAGCMKMLDWVIENYFSHNWLVHMAQFAKLELRG